MKDYTVVNEVERLYVCVLVWVCVCIRWGFVYQKVAVIMLPSRSQVFQPVRKTRGEVRREEERWGEVRWKKVRGGFSGTRKTCWEWFTSSAGPPTSTATSSGTSAQFLLSLTYSILKYQVRGQFLSDAQRKHSWVFLCDLYWPFMPTFTSTHSSADVTCSRVLVAFKKRKRKKNPKPNVRNLFSREKH